jgi:hypothetical protein
VIAIQIGAAMARIERRHKALAAVSLSITRLAER